MPKYYRVANAEENIFETSSVELAEELHNISVEEILEIYGVEDVDDLNDALEDHLYFDEDGHFGAGIYYNGVCCCESLQDLKSYFALGSEGLDESVILVFAGEYIGSCNDGDVVSPTEIIEILSIDSIN